MWKQSTVALEKFAIFYQGSGPRERNLAQWADLCCVERMVFTRIPLVKQ